MRFFLLILAAVASVASAQPASTFPNKPIRLIAPFAPGGALDLIARGVGAKLSEIYGQPVVVENRAGASGVIGSEAVKNSPADGYTLLLGATATHGVNPALNPNLPYDAVKDFTPISLLATIPHALVVNASSPMKTVQDLVRLGKSGQPLNYGSAGPGTPHHLAAELFKTLTGIKAEHVPYKGSGPALADLMGGQIQFISVELTAAEPHIKSGKLKALATATAQRVPGLDLPTVAEAGYPAFLVTSWYAIFGPAGMPRDVTDKLSADIAKALAFPDLNARLRGLGTTPVGSTPEELGTHVKNEVARWTQVVKTANVKPE